MGGGTKRIELINAVLAVRPHGPPPDGRAVQRLGCPRHLLQAGGDATRLAGRRARESHARHPGEGRLADARVEATEVLVLAEQQGIEDAAARKKETLPLSRIVTVKGLQKRMVGVGERQRVTLEGEFPSYLLFRTGAETYDYKLLSASSPGCPRARGMTAALPSRATSRDAAGRLPRRECEAPGAAAAVAAATCGDGGTGSALPCRGATPW